MGKIKWDPMGCRSGSGQGRPVRDSVRSKNSTLHFVDAFFSVGRGEVVGKNIFRS